MTEKLAIVTGTSSGIGEALTGQLLDRGWRVLGVARREVKRPESAYRHVRADLADPSVPGTLLAPLLQAELAFGACDCLALVNNAATPGQLRGFGDLDSARTYQDLAVNLAAPLALMDMALRSRPAGARLRIVNISSGLAYRPMPGGAEYCASKAGLLMAGQVLASEAHEDTALFSYAPGIVDTEMQKTLRGQSEDDFESVATFRAMHEEGRLAAARDVVQPIIDFLDDPAASGFREGRYEP